MKIIESRLVGSTGKIEKLPEPTHPEVAFAGRSNVGKSSLLNAITNRIGLFKVGKTPGRTRTIVHAEVRLDNDTKMYLVDLPGYGYAKVSKDAQDNWSEFMFSYLCQRPTLHLVIILLDVRRTINEEEIQLIEFLNHHQVPALLVGTKLDKVPKNQQKILLEKIKKETGIQVLGTSAQEKTGTEQLLNIMAKYCGFA